MPTTLTNGLQLPDKGSVDWYSSMQSNYNLIDTHLGNTDTHVTAEDKANWNSKQGSLSQAQLDAIAQVATNTSDIATLQSGKADASHTHSSSDITDIDDYATKDYVDNSISGLVDNAPAALDTLKELSTALNDDANFASTVTTALAAKANSADLATVATSGSYTDLDDKPTINDSTITIQKNGSTVDTFTTNGSAKTINIPVPTKTSDLTNDSNFVVSSSLATVATSGFYNDLENKPYIPDKISDLIDDSNFVDTSNPAVASGITSAKVTDYDTHISDTDIHVTTADKATWNTVTSKANDSDVVHKSGDETVGGAKTFSSDLTVANTDTTANTPNLNLRNYRVDRVTTDTGVQTITFLDKNAKALTSIESRRISNGNTGTNILTYNTDDSNNTVSGGVSIIKSKTDTSFSPNADNAVTCGRALAKWSGVYSTEYYYGANNTPFTDKFVTTDTNQIIGGIKTFSNDIRISKASPFCNMFSNGYIKGQAPSSNIYSGIRFFDDINSGSTNSITGGFEVEYNRDGYNKSYIASRNYVGETHKIFTIGLRVPNDDTRSIDFLPSVNNIVNLGTSTNKWKSFNGVEPSSLSLPDLSNGIDISSYVTHLDKVVNSYTPSVNGWISIRVKKTSLAHTSLMIYQTGGLLSSCETTEFGIMGTNLPVIANQNVEIYIIADSLASAKFFPCQGNV